MSAHERLVDALTEVVGRDGYVNLTVEKILAQAGVSRATFYQFFANAEDCFWSAYRHHSDRLLSDVIASVRGSARRERAVLDAVLATVTVQPQMARLLMREGVAAGPAGLVERDALIARLERAITACATAQYTTDLPPAILIGGTFRFIAMRLTDGGALDRLGDEVREWAETFARRSSQPGWSARLTPALPQELWRSPARPIRVRRRGDPRERILRATAATVAERGYRAMTVADIVAAAGVSRRLFYNEFASKPAAFMAAYEHMFQRTLAACAPAFFSSREWPERVWQSALAFTGFLSSEPSFAYLGFVECYAIGPDFVQRLHDTQLAFTLFLEEGYRQRPEAAALSRSCASLTAAAIFEAGFQGSRRGASLYSRRLQPLAVYIALAPFIGLDEAGEFVSRKLAATAPV